MNAVGDEKTAAKLLNGLNLVGAVGEGQFNELLAEYFSSTPASVDDAVSDDDSLSGSDTEEVIPIDSVDDIGPGLPDDEYSNEVGDAVQGEINNNNDTEIEVGLDSGQVPDDGVEHNAGQEPVVHVDVATEVMAAINQDELIEPEDAEMLKIKQHKCSCTAFKKGHCMSRLSDELVYSIRLNMSAMTDYDRDLILIGKVSATMNRSAMTERPRKGPNKQTERKRQNTHYFVEGRRVCREAFKFIHA